MLAGMIIGATLVVAALVVVRFGHAMLAGDRYFVGFSLVALAIVAAVVTVVLGNGDGRPEPGAASTAGLAVQDMARVASGLRGPEPDLPRANSVAPVPSLIDGLRQRLESSPDDARGWALLAQSYAFVGEADLAEAAVARAVELGFDEADLRQRVASAHRDPHAGLPGFASND